MVDRWSDRLARLDRAVDRHMSETVRFVPMRRGDYSAGLPDPDRTPFELDGVMVFERGEDNIGGSSREVRNARIITARAELHVRPELLAGREVRKDDQAEAVATGVVYLVNRIDRSHPGRVVFHLTIDASAE